MIKFLEGVTLIFTAEAKLNTAMMHSLLIIWQKLVQIYSNIFTSVDFFSPSLMNNIMCHQLQMGTLQSWLDADFLQAHMCSVKFKECIVVMATC